MKRLIIVVAIVTILIGCGSQGESKTPELTREQKLDAFFPKLPQIQSFDESLSDCRGRLSYENLSKDDGWSVTYYDVMDLTHIELSEYYRKLNDWVIIPKDICSQFNQGRYVPNISIRIHRDTTGYIRTIILKANGAPLDWSALNEKKVYYDTFNFSRTYGDGYGIDELDTDYLKTETFIDGGRVADYVKNGFVSEGMGSISFSIAPSLDMYRCDRYDKNLNKSEIDYSSLRDLDQWESNRYVSVLRDYNQTEKLILRAVAYIS